MTAQLAFGLDVLFGFMAWGIVAARTIWPALRDKPRTEALSAILVLHCFRFIGLSFLVPGVVSPDLPRAFAAPAAYGDFLSMLLALLALATLRTPFGIAAVWTFNIVGTADLVHAFYAGIRYIGDKPGLQGAAYFIPTVVVPLLLITHGLVFRILLTKARR